MRPCFVVYRRKATVTSRERRRKVDISDLSKPDTYARTYPAGFNRMRIACVGTGSYPQAPGGLAKYLDGMTRAFLRTGDAVDLFVTGYPQLDIERARAYSIGKPGDPLWKRMLDARRGFAKNFHDPY